MTKTPRAKLEEEIEITIDLLKGYKDHQQQRLNRKSWLATQLQVWPIMLGFQNKAHADELERILKHYEDTEKMISELSSDLKEAQDELAVLISHD